GRRLRTPRPRPPVLRRQRGDDRGDGRVQARRRAHEPAQPHGRAVAEAVTDGRASAGARVGLAGGIAPSVLGAYTPASLYLTPNAMTSPLTRSSALAALLLLPA